MSTNNQLIIKKKKGYFEVHHQLCVDNDFQPNKGSLLSKFKSLQEAIKFCNRYIRKEPVEYGYYILENCLK